MDSFPEYESEADDESADDDTIFQMPDLTANLETLTIPWA
jgi:hypothetical protein